MKGKGISGLYAATITPRFAQNNEIDVPGFQAVIRFLQGKHVESFALNGATGEFCLTTAAQLETILQAAIEAGVAPKHILCGVGSSGLALSLELATIAEEFGVQGLLLPMPNFFTYQQDDLSLFAKAVAATTQLPILLYNLPQFTNGLLAETVADLIQTVPNIVGIKDSSGSLDILRYLTAAAVPAIRIVGNDNVLAEAVLEGVCDGVVSGVACAMPEVVRALLEDALPGSAHFQLSAKQLRQFIQKLDDFPTPWGLKFALQARQVISAAFAQPVTERRMAQGQEFSSWLKMWLPQVLSVEETVSR